MEKELTAFLNYRKRQDLFRKTKEVTKLGSSRIKVGGCIYCDLSSNDYLGLSSHPKIKASLQRGADVVSASSASALVSGYTDIHCKLEESIADFKSKEDAIVLGTGWQTNVGVIDALLSAKDAIFCDRLSHASILDGARLSGARLFRFRHNDSDHLRTLLKKHRGKYKKAMVVTESVFSMDGDLAPLEDIVEIKKDFDFLLMVDEAHATGLFGENGAGVVNEKKLCAEVDLIMGTFSKALAGFGAYVATSKKIKHFLVNACRSYIYSTALPPALVSSNLESLEIVQKERHRADELLKMVSIFRKQLEREGFQVKGSTQIVPIILGETKKVIEVSKELQSKFWWVVPVRPPTVPKNISRIRISLTYDHDLEQLNRFKEDLIRSVR